MSRKARSITLSISDRDKAQLEKLALELGFKWGDRPNISKLVEAIARKQLVVAKNNDWSTERINGLYQIMGLLSDRGQIESALLLAQILLERSEVSIPLQYELKNFVAKTVQPQRQQVEKYIRQQKPFVLSYQDAMGQFWQLSVLYAQIQVYEQREYLECWCEETLQPQEGMMLLPALAHNRCLRFDRVLQNAILQPTDKKWRDGLAVVDVEFHLYGNLALSYRSKTNADLVDEMIYEPQTYRRVVRRVSNTFWLFRELVRYGRNCAVIAPEELRQLFRDELLAILRNYQV